ncbi:pre-mRNA-splicing factor syf2 [Brevipalpus obovatus]|uniref:pre-mRNA-splicing factor syf2 n=1 Tax=Brevipalpus obovatus TaxID=246614 RepID=UPI003D9E57CD
MADLAPSTSSSSLVINEKEKRLARLAKLKELNQKRVEGSRLNHKEVVEEYKRAKLPKNWDKKQEWINKKLEEEEKREEAKSQGLDYERIKMMNVQADEADKLNRRRMAKKNPDQGFSDFEAAAARKYEGLVKNIKPDMEHYQEVKDNLGEKAFYPDLQSALEPIHAETKEGVDRMVEDLEKQIEKRNKYSRRRKYDEDADIDYINERNMRFNKKLERFYGDYTKEIKQNLERGTAV